MPHVTFIHGISNMPAKEKLLENWEADLAVGGLDLASEGVTTSLVYWADVMYPEPKALTARFESVADGLGTAALDEDIAWTDDLPEDEKAFVESFSKKLGFDAVSPEGDAYQPPSSALDENALSSTKFEAIPLPWFIKRRVMKRLLKDVHHYLFNTKFSPRLDEEYQVQDHIRNLFISQLTEDAAANTDGAHVVVAHSMGTVISYDCLKNVADCPEVSAYMTLGCPLGLSEVHDNFKPKYHKESAFPSSKVKGDWINVYDRLDPVAFDSKITADYRKDGEKVIVDQRVSNSGAWRHSSSKYYGQEALCEHLRTLLEL